MGFQSKVAAGAAASGETTAVVAVDLRGVVSYSYWDLGQGGTSFAELDGGFRTDVGPAAALVGAQHDYLFVVSKDLDGNLFLDEQLGQAFSWMAASELRLI